jgi:hypothetical protein
VYIIEITDKHAEKSVATFSSYIQIDSQRGTTILADIHPTRGKMSDD